MNFIEIIGWIGSILFATCAVPQAYHSWKEKNSDGLTWLFLWMWTIGEILTLIYISVTSQQAPLIANYVLNLFFLAIIVWYKIFPTRKN